MHLIKNIVFIVVCWCSANSFAGKYSLEEKVDLLCMAKSGAHAETLKTELNNFISRLKKFEKNSPKSKVKKIFQLTKKEFLHHYSLLSFFNDQLDDGTYNCVTGSALFAIIFEEMDIPYVVIEVPRHVYLIAYPNQENIGVESTEEKDGIYNWTEYTKQQAVNFLLNIGKVSESEVRIKGFDKIIEDHFYTNTSHDFDALVGMHLMNRALVLQDRDEHKEALEMYYMAETYFDSPVLQYMEGGILSNLISETSYENIDIIDYITRLYAITESEVGKERVHGNFPFIMQQAFKKRKDMDFIDSTTVLVNENLEGEDRDLFLSDLDEQWANYYIQRDQFEKSLEYSTRGYALNPKNKYFEDLISAGIVFQLSNLEDGDEVELLMDEYEITYPFLTDDFKFINFKIILYAAQIGDYYSLGLAEDGYPYFEKLDSVFNHEQTDHELVDSFVAEAYGEVAAYYYRKNQFRLALNWINKAIELDDEDEFLKTRKKNIEAKLD